MTKRSVKADVGEVLERLQAQLAEVAQRLERLEQRAAAPAPAVAAPVQPSAQPAAAALAQPEIGEEELLAVSAALAAFLGVRLRIRQIRLVSTAAWAQQGRVSIQASHHLHN
jgi:methylmalonyl-CoA carboxyltransferase large subunit